jgi:hypothetical protein
MEELREIDNRGATGTDHSGGYVTGAGDPMPIRSAGPVQARIVRLRCCQ